MNRRAAVMSRSGTVDESCRPRRNIVRHHIDAGFSFFSIPMHPDFTVLLKLGCIVVNRGQNRECLTEALHFKVHQCKIRKYS